MEPLNCGLEAVPKATDDTQRVQQTEDEGSTQQTTLLETHHLDSLIDGCHTDSHSPPLVFSHLEPTATDLPASTIAASHVSVPFHSSVEHSHHQQCCPRSIHRQESDDTLLVDQLQSLAVSTTSSASGTSSYQLSSEHQDNLSPSTTHVVASGNHNQWAWSRGGHGNVSCRDEALGVGFMDDVTVDDLAGYFDQMLHLPKPMSEMAQLMYT